MRQVRGFEEAWHEELRSVVTAEQRVAENIFAALNHALVNPEQERLDRLNLAVTILTLGVGACLLLGFFTRLASLIGACFLLTVMASQPPWLPGAVTTYFGYQLVELAGLLVLFAVAAGRWAGLDYFTHAIWSRCCSGKQ